MFSIKITIEEEMLEHIRDAKAQKEACEIFTNFFSKRNKTRKYMIERIIKGTTLKHRLCNTTLLY